MKYTFGIVLVIAVIITGLVLWREVAEAPQQVVTDGTGKIATTSPYTAAPATTTLSGNAETPLPAKPSDGGAVACTMDAKQCPDGSYVGRVAPDCAFAACPTTKPAPEDSVVCTDAMKQAEVCPAIYAPVCGLVQVQCIKAPCNPVPETFSSGCNACAQKNVLSYTEGTCVVQ